MKNRIKYVERFGRRYYKDHLKKHANEKEVLSQDWWMSLHFWFDRAFYRGRQDMLSEKIEKRAFKVLEKLLGGTNKKRKAELDLLAKEGWLKREQWKSQRNPLQEALSKGEVNNRYDRLLVISTLAFLQTLPENNIISWTIKQKRLKDVYEQLNKLFAVGDKIASFYLRDVVDIFKLREVVKKQGNEIYVQPIDTWVRQVAIEIGLASKNDKDNIVKKAITDACHKFSVDPIRFNQGAWYIGSNSFKIVIDNLTKL